MIRAILAWGIGLVLLAVTVGISAGEEGLVGYWPFDEGTGNVTGDVSGNGLDGKFAGNPKWVDGKFGAALEFNGMDDHVVVADNDLLDITSNLTIMAWFNPKDLLTSHRMMVKNDSIFVIFDFGNPDTIELLVKPNNDFVESQTAEWKIDQWYHFAGTFDGNTLRVYINGKLEGEQPIGTQIAPSDLELWIGGDDLGQATDHFPGIIDEVRIYNKPLSEAEIQHVMETPQAVASAGKLTTSWGQIKSAVE